MKNKFIIKLIIATLLLFGFGLNSCSDDLNELPNDPLRVDVDQALGSNLTNYTAFLSKLYGGLAVSGPNGAGSSDIQGIDNGFGQYIRALFMMQEVPTDEAILGWTGDAGVIDMSASTFSSDNPFINAMYQRIMYQVGVCNEFLRQTTSDKLTARGVSAADQTTIQTYRAEARFLRALSYWHGLDIFGKMSFVTENDPVDPGFKPAEISKADLFKYIETELLDCSKSMGAPKSLAYGRADQAAAWMLLANLYLNAQVYTGTKRFADCSTYATKVIGQSGYTLANVPYPYLFMADNNTNGAQAEFIFPVESDGTKLQSYGSTTFITHAAVGGSMSVSAFGIDFGWGGLRTRPQFVDKFTVPSDTRAMFYTSGQNKDIASMGTFTEGYAITKFTNKTSTGTNGTNATFVDTDFPMFRVAEAYLMYAECAARGEGGTIPQALIYVNALRTRANITTPLTSLTLDNVMDERARELYWECHRRTDLIRANKFTGGDYNWQWKGNSPNGIPLSSNYSVMPIPSLVLITNSNLTQNTGY